MVISTEQKQKPSYKITKLPNITTIGFSKEVEEFNKTIINNDNWGKISGMPFKAVFISTEKGKPI